MAYGSDPMALCSHSVRKPSSGEVRALAFSTDRPAQCEPAPSWLVYPARRRGCRARWGEGRGKGGRGEEGERRNRKIKVKNKEFSKPH